MQPPVNFFENVSLLDCVKQCSLIPECTAFTYGPADEAYPADSDGLGDGADGRLGRHRRPMQTVVPEIAGDCNSGVSGDWKPTVTAASAIEGYLSQRDKPPADYPHKERYAGNFPVCWMKGSGGYGRLWSPGLVAVRISR